MKKYNRVFGYDIPKTIIIDENGGPFYNFFLYLVGQNPSAQGIYHASEESKYYEITIATSHDQLNYIAYTDQGVIQKLTDYSSLNIEDKIVAGAILSNFNAWQEYGHNVDFHIEFANVFGSYITGTFIGEGELQIENNILKIYCKENNLEWNPVVY